MLIYLLIILIKNDTKSISQILRLGEIILSFGEFKLKWLKCVMDNSTFISNTYKVQKDFQNFFNLCIKLCASVQCSIN